MIWKWGWPISSSNLTSDTSDILTCTYDKNLMQLTQKFKELSCFKGNHDDIWKWGSVISKWGWSISSSNLTSDILMCNYDKNLMQLTKKFKGLSCLQGKLWWNMKMRLCDLKMRLVYIIFEVNLKCRGMHLRWKFDETNSKIDRGNVFKWKLW